MNKLIINISIFQINEITQLVSNCNQLQTKGRLDDVKRSSCTKKLNLSEPKLDRKVEENH